MKDEEEDEFKSLNGPSVTTRFQVEVHLHDLLFVELVQQVFNVLLVVGILTGHFLKLEFAILQIKVDSIALGFGLVQLVDQLLIRLFYVLEPFLRIKKTWIIHDYNKERKKEIKQLIKLYLIMKSLSLTSRL